MLNPSNTEGGVPAGFPATRGALATLPNVTLQALMVAYGLPPAANVTDRKNALRVYFGIPLPEFV